MKRCIGYAIFAAKMDALATLEEAFYELGAVREPSARALGLMVLSRAMGHLRSEFVRDSDSLSSVEILNFLGDPEFEGEMQAVALIEFTRREMGVRSTWAQSMLDRAAIHLVGNWYERAKCAAL